VAFDRLKQQLASFKMSITFCEASVDRCALRRAWRGALRC
jgi:hypothetical protein